MGANKNWEEHKRVFLNGRMKSLLKKGYSAEEAKSMCARLGYNFDNGYLEGMSEASVEIAYRMLFSIGFPVWKYDVSLSMDYYKAYKLLHYNRTNNINVQKMKDSNNWDALRNEIREMIKNSYVYALFSEKHADSLFAYCEESVESIILKTVMESAVASLFMDLEKEGFPVRNHQVTIKMTFEEACAITHKNQSKESDKEVHH